MPAAQSGQPVRRARVLFAYDNTALAAGMKRLLAASCDVIVAANGAEVLELLLAPNASFDVLFCDVSMPVMGGVEVHRHLVSAAPQWASSMVFMTGGLVDPQAVAHLAALPNLQLEKPFSGQALLDVVAERLRPGG